MIRGGTLLLAITCTFTATSAVSASGASSIDACDFDQLAFALTQPSPPMQTSAGGFAVYNTGGRCRLALPVVLTVASRAGDALRVTPRTSRLTLLAGNLAPRAHAGFTWTTQNYCGSEVSSHRPILYTVRVGRIEVRGADGAPPCHARNEPLSVHVLFACPGARGPAIDAILPRRLPLCPP